MEPTRLRTATCSSSPTAPVARRSCSMSQGPDILTGGAGADIFPFKALPWNAGHITDFQVGVDRLDLSAIIQQSGYTGSNPIADGYLILRSDGGGGTQVLWDSDGPAPGNPWPITVTTLDGVSPVGPTAAKLFGPAATEQAAAPSPAAAAPAGVVLTSSGYRAELTGGAGADTINAGQGPDVLTGRDGADRFVFSAPPRSAGPIPHFPPGTDLLHLP